MNKITHAQMVKKLAKSGKDILSELTPEDCNLIHATLGISGEAGEILDTIKKHVIYRKPLDRENIIEELGDIEFFMEQLREALNITREQTIESNMDKLAKRYGENYEYTNQKAVVRADKV